MGLKWTAHKVTDQRRPATSTSICSLSMKAVHCWCFNYYLKHQMVSVIIYKLCHLTVGNPFWGLVGQDFIRALLANISCGMQIGWAHLVIKGIHWIHIIFKKNQVRIVIYMYVYWKKRRENDIHPIFLLEVHQTTKNRPTDRPRSLPHFDISTLICWVSLNFFWYVNYLVRLLSIY